MAISKPYNVLWPLTATQVESVDKMFRELYRNTVVGASASPTTTAGDLIYRGAAADTRLAIGAQYTVLNSSGSAPFWGLLDLANSVSGLLDIATHVSGILGVTHGGTGLNAVPTDGQMLIGRSSDNSFQLSTIIAGSGVTVTPGSGTLTIAASAGAGTTSADPILVSADTTVGSGTGSVHVETLEIGAGFKFEIPADSRAQIDANGSGYGSVQMAVQSFNAVQMAQMITGGTFTNFPVLIPAPGAGFMIVPERFVVHIVQTAGFGTSRSLQIRYHGDSTDIVTAAIVPNVAAQDRWRIFNALDTIFPSPAAGQPSPVTGAIEASFSGNLLGGGAGSVMTIYSFYRVVPYV